MDRISILLALSSTDDHAVVAGGSRRLFESLEAPFQPFDPDEQPQHPARKRVDGPSAVAW